MPRQAPAPDAEAAERLAQHLDAATDWRAYCPACGLEFRGSLASIREHAATHAPADRRPGYEVRRVAP
jgi:hypothetical protein